MMLPDQIRRADGPFSDFLTSKYLDVTSIRLTCKIGQALRRDDGLSSSRRCKSCLKQIEFIRVGDAMGSPEE